MLNEPSNPQIALFLKTLKEKFDIELVTCPSGNFMMGSPQKEIENQLIPHLGPNETPHRVIITQEFYIGKYTITQKQYEIIMGNNPSVRKMPNKPVEFVNWCQAKEFCHKLNQLTSNIRPSSYAFELPTEAQWEYACRAGTQTAFNNNTDYSSYQRCYNADEVSWNCYNAETHEVDGEDLQFPSPVGLKKPNFWGIYDMHGNVHEWCLDWSANYDIFNDVDPVNLELYPSKILRGGSCRFPPLDCRSGARFSLGPLTQHPDIGFRIALVNSENATPFPGYPEAGEDEELWIRRAFIDTKI